MLVENPAETLARWAGGDAGAEGDEETIRTGCLEGGDVTANVEDPWSACSLERFLYLEGAWAYSAKAVYICVWSALATRPVFLRPSLGRGLGFFATPYL